MYGRLVSCTGEGQAQPVRGLGQRHNGNSSHAPDFHGFEELPNLTDASSRPLGLGTGVRAFVPFADADAGVDGRLFWTQMVVPGLKPRPLDMWSGVRVTPPLQLLASPSISFSKYRGGLTSCASIPRSYAPSAVSRGPPPWAGQRSPSGTHEDASGASRQPLTASSPVVSPPPARGRDGRGAACPVRSLSPSATSGPVLLSASVFQGRTSDPASARRRAALLSRCQRPAPQHVQERPRDQLLPAWGPAPALLLPSPRPQHTASRGCSKARWSLWNPQNPWPGAPRHPPQG